MAEYQGEERTIDIGHMKLRGKMWGQSTGMPTLAMHGWLDNAASFDFLAPLLGDHLVFALDLPGHGYSDHLPEGVNYHLLDSVGFLFHVLDKLGWRQPILLGHSLGGALATLMAASMPDRVSQLILIDAIGPLSEAITNGPQRLGMAVRKIIASGKQRNKIYPSVESMIKTRIEANGFSRDAAMALVARGSVAVAGGYQWRSDPRLLLPSLLYLTEEQVLAFLGQIEAPTLLITGDRGLVVDNPLVDIRIANIKNMTHTVISGDHHLHMDSSLAVADIIRER